MQQNFAINGTIKVTKHQKLKNIYEVAKIECSTRIILFMMLRAFSTGMALIISRLRIPLHGVR